VHPGFSFFSPFFFSACLFYIFNGNKMATNFHFPFVLNLLLAVSFYLSFFCFLFFFFSKKEFVYLFAPLRHLLKEADLQNFRLENGLKIWPALWDYRHPNAQCFTAPVRPKKSTTIRKKTNNNAVTAAAATSSNPPPIATTTASVSGALPTVSAAPPPPLTPRETVTFNDVFIGKVILVIPIIDLSLSLFQSLFLVFLSLCLCDAF
jgi:hypothetical protein